MTVDQRIEKLTERHEALVQSIELMILENRERVATWTVEDEKWEKRFVQIVSSLDKLIHIAELHQHRLDSHDDRLGELEGNA